MVINELHGSVLQKYVQNVKFKKVTLTNRLKSLLVRSKILFKWIENIRPL